MKLFIVPNKGEGVYRLITEEGEPLQVIFVVTRRMQKVIWKPTGLIDKKNWLIILGNMK